jgi:hypothetical protein
VRHRRASGLTALPQGPRSGPGYSCPGPSTLSRPHPSHLQTRPNFPVVRVIWDVLAVPARAGLGPLRVVPSFRCHSFSACRPQRPGESADCAHPVFVGGVRLRPPSLDSALSTPHFNPLHVEFTFGVSRFAHALQPAELLASLADLTRHSLLCPANRGFYFRAFGRVGRPSRRRIYLQWHLGTSADRTLTCWNGS